MKVSRFLLSALAGLSFFALPIRIGDRTTVPFDWIVQRVLRFSPEAVGIYCLLLILLGAVVSVAARGRHPGTRFLERYRTSLPLVGLRVAAVPLALVYFFRLGPRVLLQSGVADLMWNTLTFSVGIIVPMGAALLVMLLRYGLLEFIGVLMRPIMRPLFRLPGRSALDSLTSWVGSYSVGL